MNALETSSESVPPELKQLHIWKRRVYLCGLGLILSGLFLLALGLRWSALLPSR